MPNDRSYLNMEDELDDESSPYDSLSDRVPPPDFKNSGQGSTQSPAEKGAAIKAAIAKKYGMGMPSQPPASAFSPAPVVEDDDIAHDPLTGMYERDQEDLNSYREAKRGSDQISNLGLSFAQIAQGGNDSKPNTALYENMGRQNSEMLKSKEEDLDRRQKIVNSIEARKMSQESRDIAREQMMATKDLARSDRMARESEKRDDREKSLAVPGYQRTGEVLPKSEEAAKLRGAVASAEQLKSKLGRLKELVHKYGTFEMGGEGGAEMESIATEIQLLAKNKDMYDLGVLTGPDMGLLQRITADPSSFGSFFTREGTRMKQIDTQAKSIDDKINSISKSMGYKRAGLSAEQEAMGRSKEIVKRQYSPSRNKTKVTYSDGSEELIDGKG